MAFSLNSDLLHKFPHPEVRKPFLKHTLEVCDCANIHFSVSLNGDQLLAALDEEDIRQVIREVLIKCELSREHSFCQKMLSWNVE